jgi:hypothetical protein
MNEIFKTMEGENKWQGNFNNIKERRKSEQKFLTCTGRKVISCLGTAVVEWMAWVKTGKSGLSENR